MRIIIERAMGSDWDLSCDAGNVEVIILDRSNDDCRRLKVDPIGGRGFGEMWAEALRHIAEHAIAAMNDEDSE